MPVDTDPYHCAGGVPARVGQRFLDHPVGGELDGGRQRPGRRAEREQHLSPGRPGPVDERGQVGQARLGAQTAVTVAAQALLGVGGRGVDGSRELVDDPARQPARSSS